MQPEKPKSKAAYEARTLSKRVIEMVLRNVQGRSDAERELALRDAYPFPNRSGVAFAEWAAEIKEQIGIDIPVNKKSKGPPAGQMPLISGPDGGEEQDGPCECSSCDIQPWDVAVGQTWVRLVLDKKWTLRARVFGQDGDVVILRRQVGHDSTLMTPAYDTTDIRVPVDELISGWRCMDSGERS